MSSLAAPSEMPFPPIAAEAFVVVCLDCGASVFEWSTPHTDRCWECAEIVDLEADR